MFRKIRNGEQLKSGEVKGVRVNLDVFVESKKSASRNVIAVVEGSDPVLKNEYVVVCGHPDGLGLREGEVLAGADDNATATVALIEIAEALMAERPKRSVIIGWFTGEEKIMNGSQYFINHCPVPAEKISACLNMDMLGRNNTDSLFLVCSDLLSSELDASIRKVNKKSGIGFGFDYRYSNLSHPDQVYFRSDHYPFVRFGIPSVWFFSGFTPDYHTPQDVTENINYEKFFKITKLVYLTAFDIGNMKAMLKLDVNPEVKSRGKHNNTEASLFRYTGK
jgi:Zn-dependent M28 family amino/carboxypeptidase